jgi:peptide/nickel transport system permease protein
MQGDISKQSTTYDDGPHSEADANGAQQAVADSLPGPTQPAIVINKTTQIPQKPTERQRPWGNVSQLLRANPRMITGLCIVGFFILMALFAPFLVHQSPTFFSNDLFQRPSATHWLGTTQRGEDIFAQLVYGARVSLLTSFVAATGATLLSVVVGLTAGYFGGWIDEGLSFLSNIFLVVPGMPLAIVIASFAVKGTLTITLVLLFTNWSWGARVLRAQTLSISQREFVRLGKAPGASFSLRFYQTRLPLWHLALSALSSTLLLRKLRSNS